MSSEAYYVRRRARVTGPFDIEQLQKMVHFKELSRFDEISHDQTVWGSAADLEVLYLIPPQDQSSVEPADKVSGSLPSSQTEKDHEDPQEAVHDPPGQRTDSEDTIPLASLESQAAKPCPSCGHRCVSDAVICVQCGYDFRTCTQLDTVRESPSDAEEKATSSPTPRTERMSSARAAAIIKAGVSSRPATPKELKHDSARRGR